MQVQDVMTRTVETVNRNDSLQEAAERMKDLDVGLLPVGENDRLVGMITDRDIPVRLTAEVSDPRTATVQDVMTPGVVYCFADQDVQEAARLMQAYQIRRLVVLDQNKRLAGIVSLGDLAVDTGDEQLAGATLEKVSEPSLRK
jgi:CBS domain-containing protein